MGLTVAYAGFRPRCVRVSAADASGAGAPARTLELEGKGSPSGGALKLALYRDASWSHTLTVRAEAFERAGCVGSAVAASEGTLTVVEAAVTQFQLSLRAQDVDADGYVDAALGGMDCRDDSDVISPEATERCDGQDSNCDGAPDDGFDVGAACSGQAVSGVHCAGVRVCQADGSAGCEAPLPTLLYRDADGDGQGRSEAEARCPGETAGYVTNGTDCDDADASTRRGVAERCDGDNKDNNCNGQDDAVELALGQSCAGFPATHCAGVRACAGGAVTCQGTVGKTGYYADGDGDGAGAGAENRQCAPPQGHVTLADDCDDGDPFVHPSASERCDGKDNDCSAETDMDPACKAETAAWTAMGSGGTEDWYAVHLFGDGGVALAGQSDTVRVRASASEPFHAPAQVCTGSWQGVWAEPGGERIFLAGEGRLGVYRPAEQTCATGNWAHASATDGSYLRSLVGLGSGSSVELHTVGERKNFDTGVSSGGRSAVWDGSESTLPESSRRNHTFVLADVHGTSRSALFAVGGGSNDARIYRFEQEESGSWAWKYQEDIGNRMLRAVWVVSPTLAFAGGEDDTLFRFDGTSWQSMAGPDAGDIVSLVAFGSTSVYALTFSTGGTDSSRVFRYDGSGWTQVGATFSPARLRDLAASGPDDLWVVGRDGVVAHWP